MRKLRSDARWHQFTAAQQSQIRQWLLVDHLSYAETHRRMRAELGLVCALSSIGPLYHYLDQLHAREHDSILQKLTDALTEPGANLAGIRTDALTVISKRLLDRALERDNTREMAVLARVMMRGERQEIQRDPIQVRRENLGLRRMEATLRELAAPQTAPIRFHQPPPAAEKRDEPAQDRP